MKFIKICLLIFFIVVLPYLLGMLPVSFQHEKNCVKDDNNRIEVKTKPGMILIAGWFFMFALFQLIAVPVIILQQSFTLLVILYDIVLCIVLAITFVKAKGIMAQQVHLLQNMWKKPPKIHWSVEKVGFIAGCVIAIGLLLFQLGATFCLEHYDGDDSYYVAASVATDLYDTMYVRDNYTGYQFTLESRHALSPIPIFIAWLTRMTGVHSTILCHSILGPFWIALMYLIYWQLADRLCGEKKHDKPWFMVFLMLWFLFGNVSIYTTETFALTRIWQGKGLLGALVIPTMFLCLFDIYRNLSADRKSRGEYFLLVCCVFTAVMATTTSIFLVPIFLGMAALLFAIRFKRFRYFIQICLTTLPALIYGVMYIVLK